MRTQDDRCERLKWYSKSGIASSLKTGCTPRRRAGHGSSAHSIPNSANAKNATGRKLSGRFSETRKARGLIVGNSTISQTTSRTDTAVVDHGKANAASTGYRSAHSNQNRLFGADARRANPPATRGAFRPVLDKPRASAWICICVVPRGGHFSNRQKANPGNDILCCVNVRTPDTRHHESKSCRAVQPKTVSNCVKRGRHAQSRLVRGTIGNSAATCCLDLPSNGRF